MVKVGTHLENWTMPAWLDSKTGLGFCHTAAIELGLDGLLLIRLSIGFRVNVSQKVECNHTL